MAMLNRFAVLGIALFLIPGCATAMRGRAQIVVISSEPSGAIVSIDGVEKDTTPTVVSLRRKSRHTIGVAIDGYAAETRAIATDADYKLTTLNLLLFHPAVAAAGVGVDVLTGASNSLTPRIIDVRLAILDSGAVAPRLSGIPWQPVPIGSRIRVSTGDQSAPTVVGTLVRVSGDTLLLESADSPVSRRISRQSIRTMELNLGPDRVRGSRDWMWRGALAGFAAGAAAGAITQSAEGAYYFAFLYGAPSGLVIGAIAGAAVPPSDIWLRLR